MTYDLDRFMSFPRVAALGVSPGGGEAVVAVAEVAPEGTRMRTALWSVDPAGGGAPRRLTRSAKGEAGPVYLPDGSVLFVSGRPDPDAKPGDEERPGALWRMPAGRGEAQLVVAPAGGVSGVAVAGASGHVALAIDVFPDAETLDDDAERAKARKDAGVAAQLFEQFPIRYWDHYLGPRTRRYFVLAPDAGSPTGFAEPRQVTVGDTLHQEGSFDLTADGSTLVYERRRSAEPTDLVVDLVAVDVATGDKRVLTAGDASYGGVVADHGGRFVACTRQEIPAGDAFDVTVWLIDLATGEGRDLTPGFDLHPGGLAWLTDDSGVAFVADERGHRPAYVVATAEGSAPRRLTGDGSFGQLHPTPGGHLVALGSGVDRPASVVRIPLDGGEPEMVDTPGTPVEVPGRVLDVEATADDGVTIRSWLVLPEGASADAPVPLVVWVHGGPVSSWNDWSWRWNPWLLAERGYAVLMPDPALSTGYGRDFLRRGYASWGHRPYTDVMAAVDAAVDRPDIDADRTALMGGSFGGYMANWVAGHTDRFRCIVTHASLWALDQFHGTTDLGPWWELEFGDPYIDPSAYVEHSPHRHVGSITTPMLVIHGELDHRVPIGEALRLWTDLQRHGVESKFLYFPDENHWILKPQNARVWYETVFAWLDEHVRGDDWQRPALL